MNSFLSPFRGQGCKIVLRRMRASAPTGRFCVALTRFSHGTVAGLSALWGAMRGIYPALCFIPQTSAFWVNLWFPESPLKLCRRSSLLITAWLKFSVFGWENRLILGNHLTAFCTLCSPFAHNGPHGAPRFAVDKVHRIHHAGAVPAAAGAVAELSPVPIHPVGTVHIALPPFGRGGGRSS